MNQQRPVIYWWKAEYKDGSYLDEYDESYKGHSFYDIKQDELIKFSLNPFDEDLAKKVTEAGSLVKAIPFLPRYEIDFDTSKRLIYYRQCFIANEEFHKCGTCGKDFHYGAGVKTVRSKYPSPICPHCGESDYFYCKKCDVKYQFEDTSNGLCPTCKGYLEQRKLTSIQYSREKRWNLYIIGMQYKVKGTNVKCLLTIDEYGNARLI